VDERLATNRAWWDERVPIHVESDFYRVDAFRAGRPVIQPFEIDELGPLDGMRLLHLQCHFGLDTLDLARLHPTLLVTGLDFSAPAVEAARRLAGEIRLADRSEFVCADVYHAVDALEGRRFDVVYTGKGALNWLPDLDLWAAAVHQLLEPGGFLYLSEFHPVASALAEAEPVPAYDYFSTEPIYIEDEKGSYSDRDAVTVHNANYDWIHPISRVISALLNVGLGLRLFHEWDFTLFDQFPYLVRGDDGRRRWPGAGTLPLMYSLKAVRPEH
jgi:SAM-dependent methyltransferase